MKLIKIAPLILFVVSLMIVSCTKDTSPKRFDRIVAKKNTSWKITNAESNGVDVFAWYGDYSFRFTEGGIIKVFRENHTDTIRANYEKGVYNKPLYLNIKFSPNDSIFKPLNDNWIVYYLKNNEFRLKKENLGDVIIFKKQ